jgi:putative ABC transport system permease protein
MPRTATIVATFLISLALSQTAVAARDLGADEPGSPASILVSRQLLEAHGLAVGDVVSLSPEPAGEGAARFRIVGFYEPTPDPMRLTSRRMEARLHLPDLVRLTASPRDPLSGEWVSKLNVALEDPADALAFSRDLSARLPALVAVPTAPPENAVGTFAALERFHVAIAVVTVFGSTAFLLALMVMRAEERRETVGILRLVGFSKGKILLEVLLEGLAIAVVGAVFGVLFAVASEGAINRFFQWRYDTSLVFVHVTVGIAWRCIALAVPLGVLAGLVTSWTLLRRDIVALLRR